MNNSDQIQNDDLSSLTLRDLLSIERTKMANERTLFSYIRTSLYLITAGIGLTELDQFKHLQTIGYISLGSSGFVWLIGIISYYKVKRRLQKIVDKDTVLKKQALEEL